MANLKDMVQQLIDAGVDPDKIRAKLASDPRVKSITDQGVDPEKVYQRLGLPASTGTQATAPVGGTSQTPPAPAGPSLGDSIAHGGAIVGAGLTKGAVEGSIGLPGTILAAEDKYLPTGVTQFLKSNPEVNYFVNGPMGVLNNALKDNVLGVNALGVNGLPTGQSLEGNLNALKLDAQPRNTLEAQLDAGARGVGAAAVTLPLGGAGAVSAPLRVGATLGSGLASGEGSYWGEKLAPKGWENTFSILGGLGGGLLAAGPIMQKIVANTVKRTLSGAEGSLSDSVLGVNAAQKALDDARAAHAKLQNEGTDLSLEHQQNLHNLDIEHQQLIKDTNTNAEAQIKAATEPAQSAITAHADALGSSDTPQALGENFQEKGSNYVDAFDNKQQDIWNPINSQVPTNTPHQPTALANILSQMNTRAGTLQPLVNMVRSALPQRMASVLTGIQNGVEAGLVPPITFGDAQVLRTAFGKALTNPKLLPDLNSSEKSAIYGATTQDMRETLRPLGLADAFDSANAASTKLYSFVKNYLTPILGDGKNMPSPETVATRLVNLGSKGGTVFKSLREQMPEAVDDMASYVVRSGKWSKLAPEAKEQLVPDPTVRASLDLHHATLENTAADINTQAKQTIDTNKERIAGIKQDQEQQKINQGKAVSESTKGLAEHINNLQEAKEAQESARRVLEMMKEATTSSAGNTMGIKALLKSDIAGQIGDLALAGVGEPAGTILRTIARAAPLAKYGVNVLRRNPVVLREGARGAFVGADENNSRNANALAPGGSVPGKRPR